MIIKSKKLCDLNEVFDKLGQNSTARIAFFIPDDSLVIFREKCNCLPKVLKQTLLTYQNGIAMLKNNFLFKQTEEVVQRFIEMGIMQHLYEYHVWVCNRPVIAIDENKPKILTMDDLEFGFTIWIAVICASILGFLFEIVRFWIKKLIRKL
ncbi:hypothetical protein ACKWTF_014687 [Chironomus riparius]